MTTPQAGLREMKKQATRTALRDAALRLALERGADNVRVDDIAEAAGVAPRTYNNYFSSREQAIVAAVTAEREARVAEAVAARPVSVRLADAVAQAIVEQYTDPGDPRALMLITSSSALRDAFLDTSAGIEHSLTGVIAERIGDTGGHTARVLSASVAAAVRIALRQWLRPTSTDSGLVAVSGSLPDLLRTALAPLTPAFEAAEAPPQRLRDELAGLCDYAWQRLLNRLDGMTDHEYLWEPVPDCWSLRPGPDGVWAPDGPRPVPDPPPVTTIAWRLAHIVGDNRFRTWLGLSPLSDREPWPLPVTAEAARAAVAAARAEQRADLLETDEAGLWQAIGGIGGPFADATRVAWVLHILDEVIHHGAEIALLRDLYARLAEPPR